MSRSYSVVKAKDNRVYSVDATLELYRICRNTLTNWNKAGLRPVDDKQPQLFRGAELNRFHRQRRLDGTRKCEINEFRCFTCKEPVVPNVETLTIEIRGPRGAWASAKCPKCDGSLQKIIDEATFHKFQACIETNTNLQSIHEGSGAKPVGIGKVASIILPEVHWLPENERTLFAFCIILKGYEVKTADAIMTAIRDFESFLDWKNFGQTTEHDVDSYRDELVRRGEASGTGRMSRSTMRHRASHLRKFFDWLVGRDENRRMSKSLSDCLKLPRSKVASALQPPPRPIPTKEDFDKILSFMPVGKTVQRRDRAIIAASILFGTRSNSTASLRFGDVDRKARKVFLDATKVRVKNSKSQTSIWFPGQETAEQIIIKWIEELTSKRIRGDDAFFPPDYNLSSEHRLMRTNSEAIEPWASDHGVRRAFQLGCEYADLEYFNPHSAKHYLRSIRDEFCRTPDQRKAWSVNMGHNTEEITEANYAKMTDERRDTMFDNIISGNLESEEDKDLLLAYHEHRLSLGTPEFERAEQLHYERRERWRGQK